MVAACDRGGCGTAVGEADLDVALVGQRLVGGDDQAGFPDEAGGAGAMRMHGDDGRRGARHDVRERGRQRGQGSGAVMAGSCKLTSIWDVAGDCVTGRMARK